MNRTYLGQCTSLVRTNNRNCTKCLDRLERFTKDLVTLHNVRRDRQRSSESNWQSFRNERNRHGYNVDDKTSNVDPVRVTLPEPGAPADNNNDIEEYHQGTNNDNEPQDLPLKWSHASLWGARQSGDLPKHSVITS